MPLVWSYSMRARTERLFSPKAFAEAAATPVASPASPGVLGGNVQRLHVVGSASAPQITGRKRPPIEDLRPADCTWPDYMVMLLEITAEIEHALMVQYLYAAYSLGHNDIPDKHRRTVWWWRRSVLAIAKEEMGHLLTVQNVLRLLGGPINLTRSDYPWTSPFYPFPFKLEPLALLSLENYLYVEMPAVIPNTPHYRRFKRQDEKRIRRLGRKRKNAYTVHEIYKAMATIVKDRSRIPDSAFHGDTYSVQASWQEWGKGYGPSSLEPDAESWASRRHSRQSAHVIVKQVASRTQAAAALDEIATQGEGPGMDDRNEPPPSHFDRFLEIFYRFKHIKGWRPARNVATNPTTVGGSNTNEYIQSQTSRMWATLFNLRYRILLSYLSHMYRLWRPADPNEPSARAGALQRTFAEMYNLKAIAEILVCMPVDDSGKCCAGPPFEMPYSLTLPIDELDCWRLHRELLTASQSLCEEQKLLTSGPADARQYLATLHAIDTQSIIWIDQIIAGAHS
jgi:hypothetical protein